MVAFGDLPWSAAFITHHSVILHICDYYYMLREQITLGSWGTRHGFYTFLDVCAYSRYNCKSEQLSFMNSGTFSLIKH